MLKKTVLLLLLFVFAVLGCARTWQFKPIEAFKPAGSVPPASACQSCHGNEYNSWKETRHSSGEYMARIPVGELRECGACHDVSAAHLENPGANVPPSVSKMSKTEKNTLCGKCHYSQALFGSDAINPHDKHALFKSVGLEGQEQQIACLDCHSGHHGKSEMLVRIKSHICFECHTSAIFTMGVFQPFNYLTFGKACQACHTVHGGSKSERWGRMGVGFCVICHFAGTAIVD